MEEMNCLSARRIISTDAKNKSATLAQHLKECQSCSAFYERQQKFNNKLVEAVEVDVPEGLAARILVEHKLSQKRQLNKRVRWTAMAASITLVLALSLVSSLHSPPSLAGVIVDHVKEEAAMLHEPGTVSLVELNQLLKPHGVRADASIGQATHAGNCLIQDKLSAHVVFVGKNAPVTLVIVPEKLSTDKVTIDDREFKGVMMKTRRGVLALLSEDHESLMDFEQRLRVSLMTFI